MNNGLWVPEQPVYLIVTKDATMITFFMAQTYHQHDLMEMLSAASTTEGGVCEKEANAKEL